MRSTVLHLVTGIFILVALVQCEKSGHIRADQNPAKPQLLAPEDGSEQLTSLTLDWRGVEGAESYKVRLSVTEDFSSPFVDNIVDSTQFAVEDLPDDTTIYWKVQSIYQNRVGSWSDIYIFTTRPDSDNSGPLTTTLKSPDDGADNLASDITLRWATVANASGYNVQLAPDESFNSLIVDKKVDTVLYQASALSGDETYYWKVKPIVENEKTQWSEVFNFSTKAADTTDESSPGGTVKIMPLGDSITEAFGYRVPLWDKLTDAGYSINYVGSQSDPHPDLPDTDHEGHGGWYIGHIADKVNGWLATYQPDYVLLMIGTNDVAWWTARTGAEIAGAHARLVDQILAHAPADTWVLVASIPPQSSMIIEPNDVDRAQLTREFNAEMEKRMQQRIDNGKQIVFVDIHSRLTVDDLSDGIHPNDRGYEIIARAWFEKLLTALP